MPVKNFGFCRLKAALQSALRTAFGLASRSAGRQWRAETGLTRSTDPVDYPEIIKDEMNPKRFSKPGLRITTGKDNSP